MVSETEISDFICRRFESDSHWLDGNCYYFAVILRDRFPGGNILYDVVEGHFLYHYAGRLYDWRGDVSEKYLAGEYNDSLIDWNTFDEYDSLQKKYIIRDCIA